MKKLFLVGNWKSNKTQSETHIFMTEFLSHDFISWLHTTDRQSELQKKIILCPPFTLLSEVAHTLEGYNLPIRLGAQNVSAFAEGAHTGEVSAREVSEFAQYVIIGHSESRKALSETDAILMKKVQQANEYQLEPIFCVQGKDTFVPEGVKIVAYEPIDSIGSGHPDTIDHVEEVAEFYKKNRHVSYVLYGGSVTADNVHRYTSLPGINGVLVGGASLDAESFSRIIKNA